MTNHYIFRKKLLLAVLLGLGLQGAMAQTQIFTKRVQTGNDDAEQEYNGSMYRNSSDLELTEDGGTNQIVGIRFQNVSIPKGSLITDAYIQFGVDETQHTATTVVHIKAEMIDSASIYSSTNSDITSRNYSADSVTWSIPVWPVADETGPDQATPDLSLLVQQLVQRAGWRSGNAMAFAITGSGRRNAHSYEGSSTRAAQLVIEYRAPVLFGRHISAASDDAEERGLNATSGVGTIDLGSSDIELVNDGNDGDQFVGLRFTGINIPKSAIITNAYVQFTQDEFKTSAVDINPAQITIKAEAIDNAPTYIGAAFNISSRTTTTDSVSWTITPNWTVADEAGPDQRTPDLTTLINAVRQRPGWQVGNPINLLITGTGRRFAQSFDKNPSKSAELVIEYVTTQPVPGPFPVAQGATWLYHDLGIDLDSSWRQLGFDDSSWEFGPAVLGYSNPNSTTLNFGPNASNKYPTYYFRHRFEVIDALLYDSLQFGILRDDGAVVYLNGNEMFRTNMPGGAVNFGTYASSTVGGSDETTYYQFKVPSASLQSGVNILQVELHQATANSSDLSFDMSVQGILKPTVNDTTVFTFGSDWKYLDNGTDQGNAWTASSFNDASWATGTAVLGYGNGDEATTVSFGNDPSDKHITTYFRKAFNVADTTYYGGLEIQLIRDDAAVVYLNGTEVYRNNIMPGAFNFDTPSFNFVEGADEYTPLIANIDKSLLNPGMNTLAVEVHKSNATETDLRFDLQLQLISDSRMLTEAVVNVACDPSSSDAIGCFTSVEPTTQGETIIFPSETHAFQLLAQQNVTTYVGTSQTMGGNNDFTGYVGVNNSSSTHGFVGVNQETTPGGVSMLSIKLDESTMTWNLDSMRKVDFAPVQSTIRNCSGGVTPWGTIISSEESTSGGDADNDGYQDIGWQVEIDPVTAEIIDHDGDGNPDKLWAMGRFNHENIVVAKDSITCYEGEDGGSSAVFKFVANAPADLSSGTLYALQRSTTDPTKGTWIVMPNTTQADRNNTRTLAPSLGATNWSGVEDCEIGVDGMVYFTSKGTGTIWRFQDNDSTVSGIEAWVSPQMYTIEHSTGISQENWGTGIDNLTFDGEGNLWALQDGGRDHLWVIRSTHTPANPQVDLFMKTPAGSEPTGLTFSPDFRYGFMSIQHPSGSNNEIVTDAAGNQVRFNSSATIVFARKQFLGASAVVPALVLANDTTLCQGDSLQLVAAASDGFVTFGGVNDTAITVSSTGTYVATVLANNGRTVSDSVSVTFANPMVDLGNDTAICGTCSVTFSAGTGFTSYLWSDGTTGATLTSGTPGTYSVTVTDANGCSATDSIELTILVGNVGDLSLDRMVEVYPNPFQDQTRVRLSLNAHAEVAIRVLDLTGKTVQVLADGRLTSGTHTFDFDAPNGGLANGMYLLQVRVGNQLTVKKLIQLKK